MSANTSASLFLIGYLVAVLVAGNEKALSQKLIAESDFVKWLSALAVVMSASKWLGEAGRVFVVMIYVAMAITAVKRTPTLFNSIADLLASKKSR